MSVALLVLLTNLLLIKIITCQYCAPPTSPYDFSNTIASSPQLSPSTAPATSYSPYSPAPPYPPSNPPPSSSCQTNAIRIAVPPCNAKISFQSYSTPKCPTCPTQTPNPVAKYSEPLPPPPPNYQCPYYPCCNNILPPANANLPPLNYQNPCCNNIPPPANVNLPPPNYQNPCCNNIPPPANVNQPPPNYQYPCCKNLPPPDNINLPPPNYHCPCCPCCKNLPPPAKIHLPPPPLPSDVLPGIFSQIPPLLPRYEDKSCRDLTKIGPPPLCDFLDFGVADEFLTNFEF